MNIINADLEKKLGDTHRLSSAGELISGYVQDGWAESVDEEKVYGEIGEVLLLLSRGCPPELVRRYDIEEGRKLYVLMKSFPIASFGGSDMTRAIFQSYMAEVAEELFLDARPPDNKLFFKIQECFSELPLSTSYYLQEEVACNIQEFDSFEIQKDYLIVKGRNRQGTSLVAMLGKKPTIEHMYNRGDSLTSGEVVPDSFVTIKDSFGLYLIRDSNIR
jgi:hypothetical protein